VALKYSPKNKDSAEQDVEDNGCPKEPSKCRCWENAEVEEEDGELQQENLRKVQYLHDIEGAKIVRDVLRGHSPNVPPESI